MVNSQVPKVIINDANNIEITVRVGGLMQAKSLEVSGYITQNTGDTAAFASFRESHDFQPDSTGAAEVQVIVTSDQLRLTVGEPLTVITSASEIWPSMLPADPDPNTSGGFKPSWTIDDQLTSHWA